MYCYEKYFSVHIDRATDYSGINHFTIYVQYVKGVRINEEKFFCKRWVHKRKIHKMVRLHWSMHGCSLFDGRP